MKSDITYHAEIHDEEFRVDSYKLFMYHYFENVIKVCEEL